MGRSSREVTPSTELAFSRKPRKNSPDSVPSTCKSPWRHPGLLSDRQKCYYLLRLFLILCIVLLGFLPSGQAFNPPIDEAGPLRVRIDGPTEITAREVSIPYKLVIENRSEQPVAGVFELSVIDDWQVAPRGTQEFSVDARGVLTINFSVTPGAETYPAHYPIHAFVRFTQEGHAHEAHPILIMETKVPARYPPKVAPEWEPYPLPANSAIRLWEVPVFRVGTQVFGQEAQFQSVGWQGSVEPHRASVQTTATNLGGITRQSLAMHPPWYQGQVGTIWYEIPLRLPEAPSIRLRFHAAVTPTGQGDGVTFRIRSAPWEALETILGEVLFEAHVADKSWRLIEVDLSKLSGRIVRLQLESHPGPRNDTGWDLSFWGEPILEIGTPPSDEIAIEDSKAIFVGNASWDGENWRYLLWPGRRGLMDPTIAIREQNGKQILFHGFRIRVLGVRVDDHRSPLPLLTAKVEPVSEGYRVRHTLHSPFGAFDILVHAFVQEGVLQFRFWLENTPGPRPFWAVQLEDIAVDRWGEEVWRVYAGHGNVVQRPGSFSLNFDGHRLATSFVGLEFPGGRSVIQAVNSPPTQLLVDPASRHVSLHGAHPLTMSFIPHQSIWKGIKVYRDTVGIKPSAGVELAAGRFVFDLWGGGYRESAQQLQRAFRYGLTDSMVLWHNWQRWGYDYRLPEIFPPNPQFGTLEEMQRLIEVCRSHGVLFGLHDNYIDFYPDAKGFSYKERIAFHQNGLPVRAWFNEGRNAQSYRFRADQVEPFLRENLAVIRERLRPTAYFIDVWASINPYDYWTADGQFFDRVYTRDSWREHFAWIRDYLGDRAPQISESGHDQLIGWLDGATANHLRVGPPVGQGRYQWAVWNWPCEDAERVPWLDAAHHHRFILHGAGYSSRYQAGLDGRLHGIFSDDYICTEILTGHPGMVPAPFGHDVVRKYWLTQPVARALAMQTIQDVTFYEDDLHRQIVRWSGGGKVYVNRGSKDWQVEDWQLPPFGFLAKIPTPQGFVQAGIVRRDGVITEFSESPSWLYVNGRKPSGNLFPITLEIERINPTKENRLELAIAWSLQTELPAGYRPFLHFCDSEGEIIFQASLPTEIVGPLAPGRYPSRAIASAPQSGWPSGRLELRAGWFDPRSGRRLPLVGVDDGTGRIRIGVLELTAKDGTLVELKWSPVRAEEDPYLKRLNPTCREINFGAVMTAGGCRLTPEGQRLLVTPLPESGSTPWTIRIRWPNLPWQLPLPKQAIAIRHDGTRGQPQPIRISGDFVEIICEPEVFGYELIP